MENKKVDLLKEKSILENEKENIQRRMTYMKSSSSRKTPDSSILKEDKEIENILRNDSSISDINLPKNTNSVNYRLENINSDIENGLSKNDLSGYTSMASYSGISDNERNTSDIKENTTNPKLQYKEFVKIFLKVKFETLHGRHKGQSIQQNLVWKEAMKQNIQQSDWEQFITDELKNTNKYDKIRKSAKTK
jgi:hypothetical protein